jgi:hypothetical protein
VVERCTAVTRVMEHQVSMTHVPKRQLVPASLVQVTRRNTSPLYSSAMLSQLIGLFRSMSMVEKHRRRGSVCYDWVPVRCFYRGN